jgi:YgiT-type zinc finger domain-containing protein
MSRDFCEYCGASLPKGRRFVTVYRHRRRPHFIFERVPARVCKSCGERYFDPRVVRTMDGWIKKRKTLSTVTPVPVIEWQASA